MKKYFFIFTLLFFSCQEEITLDIDKSEDRLVVEGAIEPGFPPYIILTRNQGYFDNINQDTYRNLFVEDADIRVSVFDSNQTLSPIYLKPFIFDSIVVYTDSTYDFKSYYDFSEEGKTYLLEIFWNGDSITSITSIPESTPLDCLWIEKNEFSDIYYESDIKAIYPDPSGIQNNVLIENKLFYHQQQDSLTCIVKEQMDPLLLLLDCGPDNLINGETFETIFPLADKAGFPGKRKFHAEHNELCKITGDSIFIEKDIALIKFSQIDEESMRFWRGVVRQAGFNSNPFTEPLNLPGNINGALGVWTGYSPVYYMVPIIQGTTIFEQHDPTFIDIL